MASVYFKTILTGITGAAYNHHFIVNLKSLESVKFQITNGQIQHRFHNIFALRSLNCYLSCFVAQIFDAYVKTFAVLVHPFQIFRNVCGIYYKKEVIFSHFIHQQIVHNASVGIQHHSILYFTYRHGAYIVCKYVLHIFFGIHTGYSDFSHM